MKLPLLRITSALLLLASVIAAGVMARSVWIILPLGLIFTVAYVLGKWRAWKAMLADSTIAKIASQLCATLGIQAILVSVFYLLGRGGAAVFGRTSAAEFSSWDGLYCTGVAVISLGLAGLVIWRGQYAPIPGFSFDQNDADQTTESASNVEIIIGKPVTLQSLFQGTHYSHSSLDVADTQAIGSNEKIIAAEAKLGFKLPESLCKIYRKQNGGSVPGICILKPGVVEPKFWDDILQPFGGYEDLMPTELLRSLHDNVTDFADPDDPDQQEMFIEGCANMVVLAQWYRLTLFLDYNTGSEPSVGFVDFEIDDWQKACVRWPSFEAFFAELKHFEAV